MFFAPVRHSPDVQRILALPRRRIDMAAAQQLANAWTPALLNGAGLYEWQKIQRMPEEQRDAAFARAALPLCEGGLGSPLRMLGIQAIALAECCRVRGLFLLAPVGAGKTLLAWLLPTVLGAQRALLVAPGGLLKNETGPALANLARYWKAPPGSLELRSYQILGHEQHATDLCRCPKCVRPKDRVEGDDEGLCPDLIMADEADCLRNRGSAVSKRIFRFKKRHKKNIFAGFSGSLMRKSVGDIARALEAALGMGSPMPLHFQELIEWCEALDLAPRGGFSRDPGALLEIAELMGVAYDPDDIDGVVSEGFSRRLNETPGVIVHDVQSCTEPITLRILKAPDDPILDRHFAEFRVTKRTPDDWDVSDPLSSIRYGSEMGCGFYSMWDPRPPLPWLEARREYSIFVREMCKASAHAMVPLETEAQVCGKYPQAPAILKWREVRPTFAPNTVSVPITASILQFAAEWMAEHSPALVWTPYLYVGRTLSRITGVPFFEAGGIAECGADIRTHSHKQSAILSLRANMRGRNLQLWNHNLLLGVPTDAPSWEQMLGRTHRQGQQRPVTLDVLISCAENLIAINKAVQEAHFVKAKQKNTNKLLIAEFDWSTYPAVALDTLPLNHPSKLRWAKAEEMAEAA